MSSEQHDSSAPTLSSSAARFPLESETKNTTCVCLCFFMLQLVPLFSLFSIYMQWSFENTVRLGNRGLIHSFTLQIHVKTLAILAITDWAVVAWWAVARIAAWAPLLRNAFHLRRCGAVFTRLLECIADSPGVNWGNWIETIMHLQSSRGPH